MGTVKYTGPVASFHCPTNAEIRSLKVHFSPKQEGTGDPSPENVRPIVGWDGVNIEHTKNNLAQFEPYGTGGINLKWTPSKAILDTSSLIRYSIYIDNSNGGSEACIRAAFFDENGSRLQSRTRSSGVPIGQSKRDYFTIQPFPSGTSYVVFGIKGSNFTIKEPMIDIFQNNAFKETPYEPYQSSTTDYEFGVLGKNKLNADAKQQVPDNTNMMPANKRIFTPNTYCVGMSWSNYYMPNNVTSYSVSNGTIAVTNGNVYGLGYPVRVVPGQAYFLSATTTNGRAHLAYFAADGTYVSGVSTNVLNSSFTVPNDVETAVIVFFSSSGEATFSNIQLELGSTATEYEPYDPNHTVYGGWVDLISGEVCEEWNVLRFSEIETNNVAIVTNYVNGVNAFFVTIPNKKIYPSRTTPLYCSTFIPITDGRPKQELLKYEITGTSSNGIIVTYTTQETNIWTEFTTAYNDPTFAYELATPITYNLAPAQLQTFLGHNNVWSNADYVEVEYDLHETQDILNRKAFIMANQPHIVKPAATPLQNFKTDVIAPLKECKVYFSPVQEGTGDPSPTNVRPISGWNEIQVGLPAEYQEVEYIGAENASPYIDTGILLTGELQTEIHYYNDKKEAFLFGSRQGRAGPFCNFNIEDNGVKCRFDYSNVGTSSINDFQSGTHDGEYLFTFTNRVGTLRNLVTDDVRPRDDYKKANGTLFATASVLLFAVRTGANINLGTSAGNLRIYSAKFWLGGTYANDVITGAELVRNFVPCIRKSDNVVGMYDTVTATFYTSQNSDTFTAGPVVNSLSILVDWTDSAGTIYGGYVDLVTGEVVREAIKITTNEIVSFHDITDRGNGVYEICLNLPIYARSERRTEAKCSCFVYGSTSTGIADRFDLTYILSQKARQVRISHYFEEAPTIDVYKEYLQSIGFEVVYYIDQESYFIDPITLKALRGTNKIWSNANGNIELAYWSH